MYLLSYRGPSAAGGISSALGALWNNPKSSALGWWHMAEGGLVYSSGLLRPGLLQPFPQDVIEGHYRFCNEFIWPLVHGFGEEVVFDSYNCHQYHELQDALLQGISKHLNKEIFVHDYQFALLAPEIPNSSFFWHIPWPASVPPVWKPFLRDLAIHIAAARKIGFQTREYANNFLNCLDEHSRRLAAPKVIVQPVPIDVELWDAQSREATALPEELTALQTPYILSVDRADYTKGIVERLKAIDAFFRLNPDQRGKITFVQLCQRSRAGIAAFDQYWERCKAAHERLNERWGDANWKPSVWINPSFSASELAVIYKHAKALIVSSIADGLNLTAKEFVASQNDQQSGALILSRRAGVWSQLRPYAFDFEPTDQIKFVAAITDALSSSDHERRFRINSMRQIIDRESLVEWAESHSSHGAAAGRLRKQFDRSSVG